MEAQKPRHIFSSILDAIGHTPLVRLNRIPKEEGVECEILAKCEYLNPTGSHKDRMAKSLVECAERNGQLKPGGTVVEATSGNAGLAISLVATVKGYRAVMAALAKSSIEKVDLMRGLGAEVVRSKPGASSMGPDSNMALAKDIAAKVPGAIFTGQFDNEANPAAHYSGTGEEIYEQCGGRLDFFFMAAGTGGTITGAGRKLKEHLPHLKVIGCDPVGSTISNPEGQSAPYKVEGVGYDFIPGNCDVRVVDEWIKFTDKDAFHCANRLIREEGLMCGGSSGGMLWCAIDYAKRHKLGKDITIVVVLADTCRNYLTKHVNNEWMFENGFITEEGYRKATCGTLIPEKRFGDEMRLGDLSTGCKEVRTVRVDATVASVWKVLQQENVLIANGSGEATDKDFRGLVTAKDVLQFVSTGKCKPTDKLDIILKTDFSILGEETRVSTAGKMLENRDYVLFWSEKDRKVYMVTPTTIMAAMKL